MFGQSIRTLSSRVKVASARKMASPIGITARNYTEWPMLTEEQVMIANMAKNFAEAELAPIARKTDNEHLFPTDAIKKLGELGLMGINVSPDFGGAGMDTVCYAIAMEEISKACASSGVIMSAHNSLYCAPVYKYGNQEQKEKYLTPW